MNLSTNYKLTVNTNELVWIGCYRIPFSKMTKMEIFSHGVRLYTKGWTMGLEEGCILDFHLRSREKVRQFVKGLLLGWKALEESVDWIQVQSIHIQQKGSLLDAQFVFGTKKIADLFFHLVAPVIFKDNLFEAEENEVRCSGISREAWKKAVQQLNPFTSNTVFRALIQYPKDLRVSPAITFLPQWGKNYYAISSRNVLKNNDPITFSLEKALNLYDKSRFTYKQLIEIANKYPFIHEELRGFLSQWPWAQIRGPEDAVELEVLENLLHGRPLVDRIQRAVAQVLEDLSHLVDVSLRFAV